MLEGMRYSANHNSRILRFVRRRFIMTNTGNLSAYLFGGFIAISLPATIALTQILVG